MNNLGSLKRLTLINMCLIFLLAAATLWNTLDLHSFDANTCARRDEVLDILKHNLTIAYNGPHHFNDATDKHLRTVVFNAQIVQIKSARCKV